MEKAAGTKDVLAEALRAWVACEHPNDARLADVALLVGRAFSEGGASITESCGAFGIPNGTFWLGGRRTRR